MGIYTTWQNPTFRGYIGQEKPIYTCNIQKDHLQACRGFWYAEGVNVLFTPPESG